MFKLMIVDDSEVVRVALVSFFNYKGVETIGFDDGQSAVDYLKHHHVDVILSDIFMPEISGPEMMEIIQQSKRKMPLTVFMTGSRDIDIGATYLRGARAVLIKPINSDDLLKLLTFFYQERESAKRSAQQSELDRIKLYETMGHARFGEFSRSLVHEVSSTIQKIIGRIGRISRSWSDTIASGKEQDAIISVELPEVERHLSDLIAIIDGLRKLFFESSEVKLSSENLISIIEESINLCQARLIEGNIDVKFIFGDSKLMATCNRMQIMQVVVNLLNNAVDAISYLPERSILVEATERNGLPEFSVTDSGPGIPMELRSKIMEPLFTTKGSADGMGLGLSLCKKIIEAHQGEFFLDEDSSQTKFVIRLMRSRFSR